MRRKFFTPTRIASCSSQPHCSSPPDAQAPPPRRRRRANARRRRVPMPAVEHIGINGFFSADKAQRGRIVQAAIVMDIPRGLHVNSNKPLGKFAVPTPLKLTRRAACASARQLPARLACALSASRLATSGWRSTKAAPSLRFNVTVPRQLPSSGVARIRVSVRFQSCNDEVCFPPATRDILLPIAVVGRDTTHSTASTANTSAAAGGR